MRLAASFIAVASLACIALPITIKQIASTANGEAILLTDGYAKDSITHFLSAENRSIPEYTFDEFSALENRNFSVVHVFGYGLSSKELQQLKGSPLDLHLSPAGSGITSVNWRQKLQTGEKLRIQGSFENTSPDTAQLVLNGFNTVLDSINIRPGTSQQFELNTIPRNTGKAVYSLTAVKADKVLEEEFIPVEIMQPDSLKVLMLAASPDFESRFLKNWLSQNAYEITARTTISKDKYDKAFINMPPGNVDRLTSSFLDKFDVLVTDASAFSFLSKDEQNAIQSKVQDGLGLIVKADTVLPTSFYTGLFSLYTAPGKEQQISLQLTGSNKLVPLPAEQPLYIRQQAGSQSLVIDSTLQLLASSTVYGQGKILVTTVNNTYSWMLSGNTGTYFNYWSNLLEKAAKKKSLAGNISISPAFPRIDHMTDVIAAMANTSSQLSVGESVVYLKQNAYLPFEWEGSYWPAGTGWQTVNTSDKITNVYIYDTGDWKYVAANEKMKATKQYVSAQNGTPAAQTESIAAKVPMSKFYFWIGFIICCTFLWVERKFNG